MRRRSFSLTAAGQPRILTGFPFKVGPNAQPPARVETYRGARARVKLAPQKYHTFLFFHAFLSHAPRAVAAPAGPPDAPGAGRAAFLA